MNDFCKLQSDELGFVSMSSNTFKKHLGNEKTIQEVKDMLTLLRRRENPGTIKNKTVSENKSSWKAEKNDYLRTISALQDDLLTLRTAYLSLLNSLENSRVKDKLIQSTIREHRKYYGLTLVNTNNNV